MTRRVDLHRASRLRHSLTVSVLAGLFYILLIPTNSSQAQGAPPITSSGLNTTVTQNGNTYNITGGTRPGGGLNLFYSFDEFGVPTNNIANFLNETALPTNNILGRVTGGNISNIFGMILTTGFENANLFLMNPAGFLFGPNATMNVDGMVAFTSADYLKLADNKLFTALPSSHDALLSAAPVAVYGFLGSNPGAITVQGSQFSVTDGQSISLVGGNVRIQSGTFRDGTVQPARLSAPNGKIQLASAASPGEFDTATLQPLPNVDGASFTSFGSINLAAGSTVDVSGTNNVSIRNGQFVLSVNDAVLTTATIPGAQDTIALSRGSSIVTANAGTGPGANVQIVAGNIQMDGASVKSAATGDGPGGDIAISAQAINLTGGAQVVSSSEGAGAGGNIGITATATLSIAGFDTTGTANGIVDPDSGLVRSGVYSTTSSGGKGGDISLSTPMLTMEEGALLSSLTSGDGQGGSISVIDTGAVSLASGAQITSRTDGTGHGGEIVVNATDSITMTGLSLDTFSISGIVSQTTASGNGGNISVSAPDMMLQDMGQIRSLTTSPLAGNAGTGGSITVSAPNTLSISGFSDDFGIGSGIFSTGEYGNSGSVSISGGTVNVSDRGIILTSRNLNGSSGNITLDVANFSLTGGAEIRTVSGSFGTPSTGTIKITASDTVLISGQFDTSTPSRISNESHSILGSNGGIAIQAKQFLMSDGGNILSNTAAPQGGTVNISATDSITMASGAEMINEHGSLEFGSFNLSASSITLDQSVIRSRTNGDHDAGAITLNATGGNLALSNDSHILTSTQGGSGTAGPIAVSASDSVLMSSGSTIESSSVNIASGNGGLVTVAAQNLVSLTGTGTGLFTETQATGAGGNIFVNANSVTLQNGGTLSANTSGTEATATGGSITVNATNQVTMTGGASITASSTGPGNAGNISINAGQQFEMRNSSVKTEAAQASGGNIDIQAVDRVRLVNSHISTSVLGGAGSGGNITIDPNVVVLQNSQIIAQAVQGAGGNITITTPLFLADSSSLVSASSQFGLNGTVTIQSPTSNLSGSLGPLTSKPSQVQSLLTQRCAALANGQASSFVVAGREQLPADPGSWLTSPLAFAGIDAERFGNEPVAEGTSNLEPRTSGLLANDRVSLRRLTPSGFLIANFADSEATGCHS